MIASPWLFFFFSAETDEMKRRWKRSWSILTPSDALTPPVAEIIERLQQLRWWWRSLVHDLDCMLPSTINPAFVKLKKMAVASAGFYSMLIAFWTGSPLSLPVIFRHAF